ncbi:MAG: redox-regulated ATPase YchF [Oligoflexia bacterium]|nr:redox-regulated ATPase YchF [Oligoflexia bacterium]
MKIAILGLPMAGKKTLFGLLTARDVLGPKRAGEVISGKANVWDKRVDDISKIAKPAKITYAQTDFVLCSDIDNSGGGGGQLANSWIQEAKTSDLLCIVVRGFTSEEVYHPAGSVNANRDKENLEAELIFADLDLVEKRLDRIDKDKKKVKTTAIQNLEEETILKFKKTLESNEKLNTLTLSAEEEASINSLNFLTIKPIIWCYNVDEDKLREQQQQPQQTTKSHDDVFIVSAQIEKEILAIDNLEERTEYLKDLNISSLGSDRLNIAAYDLLGLMSFYTMGKDEVRAWTIRKGTSAPKAAGKIHSDIERGFIRVEVIKYNDLMFCGNEQKIRTLGKFMVKGQDYIIEDGDICNFLFNV